MKIFSLIPATAGFEDGLIQIGTVLLNLSLLTEKTSQFIRDYTPKANNIVIALILLLQISTFLYVSTSHETIAMCKLNSTNTDSRTFLIWTLIVFILVNAIILILNFSGRHI